jgi:hypothetical protein
LNLLRLSQPQGAYFLSFCSTFCFNSCGAALALPLQLFALCLSSSNHRLFATLRSKYGGFLFALGSQNSGSPIRLGLLDHGCFKLFLFAENFLFLDRYLLLSANTLDTNLFRNYLLPCPRFGERSSLFRGGALTLDLRQVLSSFDLRLASRRSYQSLGLEPYFLALLHGKRSFDL